MKALDVEAVQAFVLVADLKSFTRAAEALETTQSMVSLKIKRLEEGLGRRLLERTPRLVRLSADGASFLGPARALVAAHQGALGAFVPGQRRLAVGLSHYVVGPELPVLLKRLRQAAPGLVLEMRVAGSRDMLDAFDRGQVDAAIVLRHDDRRADGEVIHTEEFGWMAAADFEHRPGAALRLAAQAEFCGVRNMAIAALDAAGIGWTEVFVGGGIPTVGAAVAAGLAVAALPRRLAPSGTVEVGAALGLPPLPARDVVLYAGAGEAKARAALNGLAAAIRATA